MTVPETALKGNRKEVFILAILALTASASFGLGMLADRQLAGQGTAGEGTAAQQPIPAQEAAPAS